MKLLALVAALVLSLLGLAGPATADDPAPVVTWPEITALNPEQTPYVFHVEYSGTDTLRAHWGGHVQEITGSGDVEMVLPTDDEGVVWVDRCDAAGTCTDVSYSPLLSVFRAHRFGTLHTEAAGPAKDNALDFYLWPVEVGTDVSWHLSDPSGTEVSSGTDFVIPDSGGSASFQYDVPADGPSGNYRLVVDVASDSSTYGHLEGRASRSVAVDTEAPTGTLSLSAPKIYPAPDGYQDTIDLVGQWHGASSSRLQVVSPSGSVVAQWFASRRTHWEGKDQHGDRLPAGSYTVRLVGEDRVGNVAQVSRPLVISDKRLVARTWTRTFSATDTISSTWVGSCSTLGKPASHGWSESFGLYSQTKCTRAAPSPVVVYSGVWLPRSPGGTYGDVSISMYGGAARGHSSAYVVLGLRRAGDESFQDRAQFAGGMGWHRMRSIHATPFVRYDDGDPFVIWQTGLSEGSRYDVKSYKLSLRYFVLR
jgi:hypothetical protein